MASADGINYFLPNFFSMSSLWTNHMFGGYPIAADVQSMTFYPLAILARLLGRWNLFIVVAYVLLSSFTYGYVYNQTKSKLAGLSSGIIFGMSGFMMVHLGHPTVIHAAVWLPLLIWSLEELRNNSNKFHWVIIGGIAVALIILSGHPQISLYILGLAMFYCLIMGRSSSAGCWKYYGISLFMLFIGIGLAAVQLIPTIELSSFGDRQKISFEETNHFRLELKSIIIILLPFIFGSDSPFGGIPNYFGPWNLAELTGYVGWLPVFMAILGFVSYKKKQAVVWFWMGAVIIAFLLALGSTTPLAYLMYYVPIYNKFRCLSRHLLEFSFAISVLAGFGISAFQNQLIEKKRIKKLLKTVSIIIAILLFVGLTGITIVQDLLIQYINSKGNQINSLLPWVFHAIGIPLLLFIVSAVFLTYFLSNAHTQRGKILLIMLIAIDLSSFGLFSWQDQAARLSDIDPPTTVKQFKPLLDDSHQRIVSVRGRLEPKESIPVNQTRLWGISTVNGYSPLIMDRVSQFFEMIDLGEISKQTMAPENQSLNLLSVRYAFTKEKSSYLSDAKRWTYIKSINDTKIYENNYHLPRVWLVPEVILLKPEEIIQTVKTSVLPDGRVFQPISQALVETPIPFQGEKWDAESKTTILRLLHEEIIIESQSKSSSFLVLSDTYYPGWEARVDGKITPIYQTNYISRGLVLSPGNHRIEFKFKPQKVTYGIIISTIFLFICIILAIVLITRTIQNKSTPRISPFGETLKL